MSVSLASHLPQNPSFTAYDAHSKATPLCFGRNALRSATHHRRRIELRLPMFAIDHAATALLLKRCYPSVPIAPILASVQAMELAWVGLNYLGIERTTTEATVRSVADIHLAYMPYSHSVGTA